MGRPIVVVVRAVRGVLASFQPLAVLYIGLMVAGRDVLISL
jgi:hypothetical protein